MNELIEQGKKNLAKFDAMDSDLKKAFQEAGKKNCIVLSNGGEWRETCNDILFLDELRYRIAPAYQPPEPQPAQWIRDKYRVEEIRIDDHTHTLFVGGLSLIHVLEIPQLVGFVFAEKPDEIWDTAHKFESCGICSSANRADYTPITARWAIFKK